MKQERTLELVERAIAGDEQALSELCEAKVKKILYTATGILGNLHDGEEVMQEVLIKVFQNIGKLREPKYFDLWLYRVTLNECNDQRKIRMSMNRDIQISEEQFEGIPEERIEFLPPEFLEDSEKRSMLLDVVENLWPHYRTVVLLHYFDGLSYQQIADVMRVTVQSVNNNLRRARKKIREELEKLSHTKFDSVFAVAPVPVLTGAMELRANEMVSPQNARQYVLDAKMSCQKVNVARTLRRHAIQQAKRVFPMAAGVIAGAAAAVLVTFALVSGAIAGPPSNRPLSSPATAAQGYPQRPQAVTVAEEGLEIDETLSPMAGQAPQPGPAEDGEVAAARQDVRGGLVLKDRDGNIVEDAQAYLSGVVVKLLDKMGTVSAETVTNSEGEFFFEDASVGYAIQVETADTPLAPASENPKGIRTLGAGADGDTAVLYLNKTSISKVTIDFLGSECECGHVNPKEAVAIPIDKMDKPQTWEIRNEAGNVVAHGESGAIMTEGFQNLQEGKYTLDWQIGDIAGNTGIARREFRIVHGAVDPELYD